MAQILALQLVAQRRTKKKREAAVRHLVHLMWTPAPSFPSPSETGPSVQEVMSLYGRVDSCEAVEALWRERGS